MKNRIKHVSYLLVLLFTLVALIGCTNNDENANNVSDSNANESQQDSENNSEENGGVVTVPEPIEPEELGSGDVKWEESETSDGYALVTNEDGKTLGYSKDSGVQVIQVDGFAFKDLNKNNLLDAYEDWRLDNSLRATNLAALLPAEDIAGLMLFSGHQSQISEELTEDQVAFLDAGGRAVLNAGPNASTADTVKWNNALQAYSETTGFGIPVNTSSDPRNAGVATIPSNLGLTATFDPEFIQELGNLTSVEYRLLGIGTLLGPQIEITAEPRWNRIDGAFGEDPALARDIAAAFVNGVQSTFDENGNDLGWGPYSMNAMVKHWPGEGAGEGGREAHFFGGKYQVYPGGQFETHLIPFVDGAFNLSGSTESATAVMASYSIAYDEDRTYGELVGTAFSEYKINQLLREQHGFDGVVTTDWGAVDGENYGVEELTVPERILLALTAGTDQFGGLNDKEVVVEAYELGASELGEEAARALFEQSAVRLLKNVFKVGLFENAYVNLEEAQSIVLSEENQELAHEAQLRSIVMLKNSNNAIASNNSDEKPTVYVPMRFAPPVSSPWGPGTPAQWELPVDMEILNKYFNVVTDTPKETLTGPADEEGNPTASVEDIVRATPSELASVDFALAVITDPDNAGNYFEGYGYDHENEEYIPISLQYGEYTADSEFVRKESLSGDITIEEEANGYVVEEIEVKENRSYFGKSANVLNYEDVNTVKYAAENIPEDAPVIVAVKADGPMIFSELDPYADSILIAFGTEIGAAGIEDEAIVKLAAGKAEPSALLPIQMPANMETVEAQLEDVPRDMEPYVDSEGNTYDFSFGLNWSGEIEDDRTEKYDVPALVTPSNGN